MKAHLTIDQHGCARCDGDGHAGLTFVELERPVVAGGVELTHWATCPTTGEPILLAVRDSDVSHAPHTTTIELDGDRADLPPESSSP